MSSNRVRKTVRRTTPAVLVGLCAPAVLVALPLLLVTTVSFDLLRRRSDLPATRLAGMAANYLLLEWIGIVIALFLWVVTGFGAFLSRPWSQRLHYRVQEWWAQAMTRAVRRWLGLRFEVENPDVLNDEPIILAAHHASFFDALLPSFLVRSSGRRPARHVLKRELGFDPCLGIYGRRLPNQFVDRSSGSPEETVAIRELAATAGNASLVIFPEGTFRSVTNPDRIFRRLREENPARAARLQLAHMLPVRPGGLLALCAGAPAHDIVFVAHVGLAGADSFRSIAASVPFTKPVAVRLWRIPASALHHDSRHALRTVDAIWQEMDDWIAGQAVRPGTSVRSR